MTHRATRHQQRFQALAGLSASLVILLAGCDHRSANTKALEGSAKDLHALSGASPEPGQDEAQKTAFTKVSKDLADSAQSQNLNEKTPASLLVSQSQLGLGQNIAADASLAERKALNLITGVEGRLSQWRTHSAIAGAADSYDITKELADIAKSKQKKDADIRAEQEHRATVLAQLQDLQAKAKTKNDAAVASEAQYAQLMQQAVKLTATKASPVVEQANGIKRESDLLRLAGTKLDAQAQSVAPLITEIDAVIGQLTNQKKDLESTEAALNKQLGASKAEATDARTSASSAAAEIDKGVAAIAKVRADEVDPLSTKALGFFSKAVTAARDASQQSPGAGKAVLGDANLAVAQAHWDKAQGLRAYARLLASLAKAEPALPAGSTYTEQAKATQDAAKQEMEAAAAALDSAKSAFSSVRVSGDAKDRLQKLADLLDTAIKVTKEEDISASADLSSLTGKHAPAAPAPSGAEAAAGSPAPATAGATATDPALLVMIDAFLAAGREDRVADQVAMFNVADSARGSAEAMVSVGLEAARADKACKAKFNKGLKEILASNPMMAQMMAQQKNLDPDKMKTLKASDLQITMNGPDAATATAQGIPPLSFKRVSGKWLYNDPTLEAMGPQLAMMGPMMAPVAKAFDEFASDVEAGKYPTPEAAGQALMAKLMAGRMPGGPGGG